MDNQLRKALERRGLPAASSERDAQDFYQHLSMDDKGKLGVELAGPDVRVPDPEPLQVREALVDEELTTRSVSLRAATIDEQQRSVEAVIATEQPVTVWDWRRGEPIDEILLIDGARLPDQLPLLANHSRWDLDDVLGSARKISADRAQILARLYFAEGDDPADRAWNKARQGHLTDVSIGYRVVESTDIQPDSTAKVNGRTFKSGRRALRIATAWEPVEVSLVPIGADQAAKLRQSKPFRLRGKNTMDPKLRTYLESIGLRAEADDAEANLFQGKLTGEQQTRADELAAAGQRADPPADPPPATPPPANTQRSDPPAATATTSPDPAEIARQATTAERERVRQITELAGTDLPQAVRERAIGEGWDVNRASQEFLAALRTGRQPSDPPVPGGPAIHGRDAATGLSARTLAAGLIAGNGLDPTQHRMHNGRQTPLRANQITEQEAEQGERFARLSAVDICRQAAFLDTGRAILDPEEAIRSAVSGATLTNVFTTSAYASLMSAWETIGDTTAGWCDEEDVANFQTQEDVSLTPSTRLEQLPRGDTAKHATASDSKETYKIARYAKQFVIDEQDILDDRLGALMRMPAEMGEAARRVRPDLVYSIMLENPSLVADSTAVFHADHSNLGSAVLGATSLKAGISAMVKQRINSNVLNIRPRFLIVPAELEWTARELTASVALSKLFSTSNDPFYAQLNLLAQEGIRVVIDDRLGATGVIDPRTGSARTGSNTAWYLAMGGTKSIRVAYRRGTNRAPSMRSFALDRGQWGIGWDINLDIGAAFLEYRPWYKSSGA